MILILMNGGELRRCIDHSRSRRQDRRTESGTGGDAPEGEMTGAPEEKKKGAAMPMPGGEMNY